MPFLSESERQTLAHICETFVPSLSAGEGESVALFNYSAAQLDIARQVEEAIELVASPQDRQQLQLFFRLAEQGLFNGLTSGNWGSFSSLSVEGRAAMLRAWGNSRFALGRRTFQSLKRLSLFLFYANMVHGSNNPAWSGFNYGGPPGGRANAPRNITPLAITEENTLYADALVIGSGAGGGVVAAELAAAGLDVIIAEKGAYYNEADFHGRELDSTREMFEKYGSLTSKDLSMVVLAGSLLGGGTTINWSASFRTPDYVLREWERKFGFTGAESRDFQLSLDAVAERVGVNTDESWPNPQNLMLERGCQALGYDVATVPRNVSGCEACGFCNFGCRFGAKQGTLKTFLQDAHENGARILVRAHVDRILHQNGSVRGAAISACDAHGGQHMIIVKAKIVVVAAGAIHTPAILLRSGLSNANIGANLHLHPTTVSYGRFEEAVRGWEGPPMARYSRQFVNMDGRGYGVRLETAPIYPGIAALTLPWQSGRQHKQLMQRLDHLANIIILTRDYHAGRIEVDRNGNPVIHYRLSQYDAGHMMRGLQQALRIHRAAGAVELSGPHNNPVIYRDGEHSDFEGYLESIEALGLKPNAFALFSAHQMSSCRIGGDTATGALDPTGESYEIQNLFVADASVFPTASGANPMLSIMAAAHYIAQHIKAKL